MSKTLGRSGEGLGRRGISCSQFQTFYQTLFTPEQGPIVQFEWLLAHRSKYDIRNLSVMHDLTSGTNKIKIDMAEPEEVFEGVFEFSLEETLKDL